MEKTNEAREKRIISDDSYSEGTEHSGTKEKEKRQRKVEGEKIQI